ncbi:MAG: DUF2147 domain-containing protein [Methyloceanibacter sp.]|uniref:DUF2147 domain-containing protein n=1 Tax=Methyloceanibacter sp. TaxID=1965321 RepID=UPI003D6CAD6D
MRHHALIAAMGLLFAAALVPASPAQAASGDPTGFWKKADPGERPGKFQISKCGSGNRLLCAKIVWLQQPLDSKGRPLHDIRNENPSMRDRPILGLPIFSGLQPVGPNVWKGSIYNPEDGNTYSVTVTQVSRNQINVKGCKGWILCGERIWLRTTGPQPEPTPEPEEQIEASAEPEAAAAQASAAGAKATPQEKALSEAEILTPADEEETQPGFQYLNASANANVAAGLSGESVPSMFTLTQPIASDAAGTPAKVEPSAPPPSASAATEPAPAAQPSARSAAATPAAPPAKPQSMQAAVAPTPKPQAATAPSTTPAAVPTEPQPLAEDTVAPDGTQTAETAVTEELPLTRRQRRVMRRQGIPPEGGLLPWLR